MGKIIIAAMMVLAGVFAGIYKSTQLNKRHQQLGSLIEGLSFMENEIFYTRDRLDRVSERVAEMSQGMASEFFRNFSIKLMDNQEKNTEELWTNSIADCFGRSSSLSAKDMDALTALGSRLGKTDVIGQCENLRRTIKELSIRRAEAKLDIEKKGKLYKTMGTAAGVACAMLVI